MASYNERKQLAKSEAMSRIKLERQGRVAPSFQRYAIMFILYVAAFAIIFKRPLAEAIPMTIVVLSALYIFESLLYKYKTRKEK